MKKFIIAAMLLSSTTYAGTKNPAWYFEKVIGQSALNDHHINQYDDTTNPPQAYDITLPYGYFLVASDVESGGVSICSVTSYDLRKQRLTIEALNIETDAGTCVVTLTIFTKDKSEIKVRYSIEQTGT